MRDLLKFITCGSVDDGKSTLIGHILYDSKLLYADQERALALESKIGSRNGEIDYSLLLDGLTEEREQGITIDVAYRYFTTDARSFIVADTPGHEEYTRNMAVGASFADLAILLIDASKGVLVQTRRHARICTIMGISQFVFAVNKMDLVGYEKEPFDKIEVEIAKLCRELKISNAKIIPVSATEGDNVAKQTDRMKWYDGETLLQYLENVEIDGAEEGQGFYMPVQRVCRPDHTFRGFQGQIEEGSIAVGDEIEVLPNGEKAHVSNIYIGNKKSDSAFFGQAVTLQLDREIDVSRGSVLFRNMELNTADSVVATILWMDENPLSNGGNFFVKIGTSMIPGIVAKIQYAIDINTGKFRETSTIEKNEIAVCQIVFTDSIAVSRFRKHKTLGELILINRISFMTSACGVIDKYEKSGGYNEKRVTWRTRSACLGQQAVTIVFKTEDGFDRSTLEAVEKKLILEGRHTYLLESGIDVSAGNLADVIKHLNEAGIVVLLLVHNEGEMESLNDDNGNQVLYSKEKKSVDDIALFAKRISGYEFEIAANALYI